MWISSDSSIRLHQNKVQDSTQAATGQKVGLAWYDYQIFYIPIKYFYFPPIFSGWARRLERWLTLGECLLSGDILFIGLFINIWMLWIIFYHREYCRNHRRFCWGNKINESRQVKMCLGVRDPLYVLPGKASVCLSAKDWISHQNHDTYKI